MRTGNALEMCSPSPCSIRSTLRSALQSFRSSSSSSSFGILSSLPVSSPHPTPLPKTLYVLDSSFNPPTRAHFRIITSALEHDQAASSRPLRVLLLLATQNADKPFQAASVEQRLFMMYIFATDLMRSLAQGKKVVEDGNSSNAIYFDVGVTDKPYFHDKATAIAQSSCYECPETGRQPEQVHLIGFDTLIRLLDVKYYPPAHTLQPLDPFFARHRVRVTRRTDDAWGGREEQDAYFKALAEGAREGEGGKREWAGRIGLEDGREEGEEPVSSSRVRHAANGGNLDALRALVTDKVRTYIIEERLYMDGR